MVFTTECFMLSLVLLFVLVVFSHFIIVITSLVEKRAGLHVCASRAFVYLLYTRWFLSFFSTSWCLSVAAACDCDTAWTFLLTFLYSTNIKGASSLFFLSFSQCACTVIYSGARCLIFDRTLRLLPYFMCANSEGSGETSRMCRLAWAFAGRPCLRIIKK